MYVMLIDIHCTTRLGWRSLGHGWHDMCGDVNTNGAQYNAEIRGQAGWYKQTQVKYRLIVIVIVSSESVVMSIHCESRIYRRRRDEILWFFEITYSVNSYNDKWT
jgi:hypothetical protein